MKRVSLALSSIAGLALLSLAALLPQCGAESGDVPTAPEPSTRQAPHEAAAPTRSEKVPRPRPDGTSAGAPRASAAAGAAGPRIRGEVLLEGECRNASECIAVALDEESDAARYLEARDRARIAERLPDGAERPDPPPRVLAEGPVDEAGRFELTLPTGVRGAHVLVVGAHAFGGQTRRVTLGAEAAEVFFPLRCGARLEGELLLPAGEDPAVALAIAPQVRLRPVPTGRQPWNAAPGWRRTWADGGGRFAFDALEEREAYEWVVDASGFAPARGTIEGLSAGETRAFSVTLTRGLRLRGRVLAPGGGPLIDAEVTARPTGSLFDLDAWKRVARTAEDGSFELVALPQGTVQVRARAPGFLESRSRTLTLRSGTPLERLELTVEEGAFLAGVVRWPDGRPAADARVTVEFDPAARFGIGGFAASRGARGEGRTDRFGRFRITGLGSGPFRVTAAANSDPPQEEAGAEGDHEWSASLARVGPNREHIDLVLAPPAHLEGRVVDAEEEPLEAFRILAVRQVPSTMGAIGIESRRESFERTGGRFRIAGLAGGEWVLHAFADGYAPAETAPLAVPPPVDGAELRLVLERSATISGTVVSPEGAPVAGAFVTLRGEGPAWAASLGRGPRPAATHSDAAGLFHLQDLPAGEHALVAGAEGFAQSDPVPVEVAVGEDLTGIELVLHAGGTIEGQAFQDGEPAASSLLELVHSTDFDMLFTRTDAEGRFRIAHVRSGTWQVVLLPGIASLEDIEESAELGAGEWIADMVQAIAEVTDGETVRVVLGAPPEDPIVVRGMVRVGGQPFRGAALQFFRCGKPPLETLRRAFAGEDGSFEVVLDGPGRHFIHLLRLGRDGAQQETHELFCEVPDAPEFTLDIELPTGRIEGRVFTPEGVPAPGVRLSLTAARPALSGLLFGGRYSETTTDDRGGFVLRGVPPGEYVVAAGGMPVAGWVDRRARWARTRQRVRLGEGEVLRELQLVLAEPCAAFVTVRDERGRPVLDATVFARDAESGLPVEPFSFVTTARGGQVRFDGLPEGVFTFSARSAELASFESAPIEVRAGEQPEVELLAQRGTVLRISVRDGKGSPARASVRIIDEEGREQQCLFARTDMAERLGAATLEPGELRVGPLPPGHYDVLATAPDGRFSKKPVTLHGRPERTLVIRLR